jgi:hypothetical protein
MRASIYPLYHHLKKMIPMCANKKTTKNVPANIQKKKSSSKKVMKKSTSVTALHATPISAEPLDYEEVEQDSEQLIVTITHIECTVVVVQKWCNG